MRLRDVINCFHRTLHPDRDPLRVNAEYDALKASVVQLELILLRDCSFEVPSGMPFSVSCCAVASDGPGQIGGRLWLTLASEPHGTFWHPW